MAKRWYVIQTKPHLELFAKENLERQRYKIFFPHYEKASLRNGIKTILKLPLYPAYMFVQFDIKKTLWRSICSTQGVMSLLSATESGACPVPKGFVEELRKTADRRGCIKLEEACEVTVRYSPGETLEVSSGAFQGMVGKCVESRENRVVLLLSLLSRETRVILPVDAVMGVAAILA